jgi:hypothetical protein
MRYQLYLAERPAHPIRVLAIGDSHAALGLYPDQPDVANVAYAGENLRETRLKLRHLLPRLPRLETVLVQSQPQMLFRHRDRPPAQPYRDLASSASFHPLEPFLSQFHPCCRARAPGEAWRALTGRREKGTGPDVLPNGYLDYSPYVTYDRARFSELAANEVKSYQGAEPTPPLIEEFDTLLDELLATSARVVLIRFPLSRSYWEAMGVERMRTVDKAFVRAAEARGLRTCSSWEPQPDELHLNPDHLTQVGAKEYWPTLARCMRG